MNAFKLIMVDDHSLYRLGIRSVVTEKLPQAEILTEFGSGYELLLYLENNNIHPDIILLDIVMPKISGIEVAKVLKEKYPNIKILMLSSEVEPEIIQKLLDIGVNGYLSKLVVQDELTNAIIAILEDNLFYGQNIARILYDTYISKSTSVPDDKKNKNTVAIELSEREQEMIELLCEGLLTKEIADRLSLSKRTVDNHRTRILQKLGFRNTVELVRFAIKKQIIML